MTRTKYIDLAALLISIIPFISWILLKDSLPDKLPIHWNVSGEVDGWTTKDQLPVFLFIMTSISVITYSILRFIKFIDPKRTAQLNENIALKVGLGIVIFIAIANLLLLVPKSPGFNMTSIIITMVSLLFTFLGNLMYNIKPNYFIGIRLPWTLENEINWKRTHRLAGIVWFVGGIICAILSIMMTPKTMFFVLIGTTILLVLIPAIYSFTLFKKGNQPG